jgi:aminoglycoside phosphotransferase (APT) family kinase protein
MTESLRHSEFALNPQLVRALLHSQFPSLGVGSVQFLGEGWDSAAYLVDGEWVFRFPKRCERQIWVESEIATLRLLATRRLGIGIPVPAHVGQPGRLFPCPFMGYRFLAGTPGDRVEIGSVERTESARRLGELLTAVHAIDVDEAAALGVRPYDSPASEALAETAAMRDIVSPQLPAELASLCRPFLEGTCAIPETSSHRTCLVHGDLVDEHILLDDAGGVSGVIDWGDSCLADPVIDFGGLYAWLGEDFARNVLAHYALPWDPSFLDQIAFRARCYALTAFGFSLKGHDTSHANRLPLVYNAFG